MKREELTRRAFNIDSRTVWVEQQNIKDMIIPKDNFPLGPGEYSPSFPAERHISTPKLGSNRRLIDQFLPFKSRIVRDDSTIIDVPFSKSKSYSTDFKSRGDQMTIFHDHSTRQPLDPNKRFCKTPGCELPLDSLLGPIPTSDGLKKPTQVVFSKYEAERNPTRKALPSYDIKYDSDVLKKTTALGTIPKATRFREMMIEDLAPAPTANMKK